LVSVSDASPEPSPPEADGDDDEDDEADGEDEEDDDPVDPAEPEVSANAIAGIDAIAAPTPNATASAPTRPT